MPERMGQSPEESELETTSSGETEKSTSFTEAMDLAAKLESEWRQLYEEERKGGKNGVYSSRESVSIMDRKSEALQTARRAFPAYIKEHGLEATLGDLDRRRGQGEYQATHDMMFNVVKIGVGDGSPEDIQKLLDLLEKIKDKDLQDEGKFLVGGEINSAVEQLQRRIGDLSEELRRSMNLQDNLKNLRKSIKG